MPGRRLDAGLMPRRFLCLFHFAVFTGCGEKVVPVSNKAPEIFTDAAGQVWALIVVDDSYSRLSDYHVMRWQIGWTRLD